MLKFCKHEVVGLATLPGFSEKWLQDRIAEDPSILGLGELLMRDRERRQERAGRLDLLLEDPDENTRYEVELMLGRLDESHIIRVIEYWDIERRRYPAYDHCAVLIAEDVTSRFLNVLSLFSGTIPLIVLQMNALRFGEDVALHFARILDQRALRDDDGEATASAPADRAYWMKRAAPEMVGLAEQVVGVVNEKALTKHELNFNKHYVGLAAQGNANNFVVLWPRKKHLLVQTQMENAQAMADKLREENLLVQHRGDALRIRLDKDSFKTSETVVRELLHGGVAYAEA